MAVWTIPLGSLVVLRVDYLSGRRVLVVGWVVDVRREERIRWVALEPEQTGLYLGYRDSAFGERTHSYLEFLMGDEIVQFRYDEWLDGQYTVEEYREGEYSD